MLTPSVSAWSINPAKWTFYNVDDYELKPIVFDMEITNTDATPMKVELSLITPEYLYEGSEAFPMFSWIDITQSSVTIPGDSSVKIPIIITIPVDYEKNETIISNYNKTYEAWIFADMVEGGGNIQVDYRCRWVFKTPLRYVPPSERAGYSDIGFYVMIFGAIILIAIVTYIVYRRITKKPKPVTTVKTKSKRHSKEIKKEESADDLFT